MKKTLFLLLIGLFAWQVGSAKQPPQSYQQFKAEFIGMSEQKKIFNWSEKTRRWVHFGAGVGLVGTSGYFLMNNEMKKFGYTALIGGGLYVTYIIISSISDSGSSDLPPWWE